MGDVLRRFLNLFRSRMSPLGERLAALMAPERWAEWEVYNSDYSIISFFRVRHQSVPILIVEYWDGSCGVFDESYDVVVLPSRIENARLRRAASRLVKHFRHAVKERKQTAITEELFRALLTDEERAIEDLLR